MELGEVKNSPDFSDKKPHLAVRIFGGQSTVSSLQSSLHVEDKGFDQYTAPLLFKSYKKIKFWHTLFLRGARVRSFSPLD